MQLEDLYAAAARSGLLTDAVAHGITRPVDFRAPDTDVLDGFAVSRDYTLRCPASYWPTLASGNTIVIAGTDYRVREVTAVGDGSEWRVSLTKR